jgi:hypothetical protein
MSDTKGSVKLEGPKTRALREIQEKAAAARRKTDMKGAVQAAFAFAADMFPTAKDLRLEEVEARSGGWSVVVSFTTGEPGTLAQVMGGGPPRLFKTIAIDSESGRAQSLKVWKQ